MPENQMPEGQMPKDEKTDLRRILHGAEAVDSIHHAQEFLVAAGGFNATLETLDNVVAEIRTDTGYEGGDLGDED